MHLMDLLQLATKASHIFLNTVSDVILRIHTQGLPVYATYIDSNKNCKLL